MATKEIDRKKELASHTDNEDCAFVPAVSASEIRAFRESRGWTQEQFADQYGLSIRTVKRWESSTPKQVASVSRIVLDWMNWRTHSTKQPA